MTKATENDTGTPDAPKRRMRPRVPTRGRGIARYASLVDATEQLLQQHSSDEIGLYQIAEQAGVPPASVYHFFPTKEAAFLALAQRYLEAFSDIVGSVPPEALESWQALLAWDQRQAMNYYNSHPPALKIFLGGFGGEETKQANRSWTEQSARTLFHRFNRMFIMPPLENGERMFHIHLEIIDAIWSISYLQHGEVTEEYYNEALQACISYCRLYLPQHMKLRDEYSALVQRGLPIPAAALSAPENAPDPIAELDDI